MITSYILATVYLDLLGDDLVTSLLEVCDSRTQTEASAKLKRIHRGDSVAILHMLQDGVCLYVIRSHVVILVRMAYHHPELVQLPESELMG